MRGSDGLGGRWEVDGEAEFFERDFGDCGVRRKEESEGKVSPE